MTDDFRHPTALPDAACAAVDERLMDYLEGELAAADRARLDAHLAACARCRALVADLRALSADAAALLALRPGRDLWAGIAERIEAPVVPLPARDGAPALHVHPTVRNAEPRLRAAVAFLRRHLVAAAV
ncbi:zf-HC2 domain-containing protein, partial [Roseisolibacter sp. H3M3-2]|uniref:zf-HC2 domain-containing protein n=1 Tax=Roseisolibacter sp. H3M3-2 TaxID=3031323 RepID=UPI0023DC8DA6